MSGRTKCRAGTRDFHRLGRLFKSCWLIALRFVRAAAIRLARSSRTSSGWQPRFDIDVDQIVIVRLEHGGDIAVDELAAVIVHDSRFGALHHLERRLQLRGDRFTVQADEQLVMYDIAAEGIDGTQQEVMRAIAAKLAEHDLLEDAGGMTLPSAGMPGPRFFGLHGNRSCWNRYSLEYGHPEP
jgi:hypothetical protein